MRRAAAALAALSAGCVLLPTLGGPAPRRGPPPAPLPGGLVDLRGIVHCHSRLSNDSRGEVEDIAAAARDVGARFVILTDHLRRPTRVQGPDGDVGGVLFIPGFETRSEGGGSLVGLGVRVGIDPRAGDAAVAARVHRLGGLVAIGHAEERPAPGAPLEAFEAGAHGPPLTFIDAVELMNPHADLADEARPWLALRAIALPPGAFLRSLTDRQVQAATVYDRNARARPLAALGGCDAHEAVRLLGPLGGAVDSYRRVFRNATTHVLARAVDRAAVLEALAAGRCWAASELDADSTGLHVTARQGEEVLAELGGAVALEPGLELRVELPRRARVVVLRNGAPIVSRCARRLSVPLRLPGAYRIEAVLEGAPWIATSAIRVTR